MHATKTICKVSYYNNPSLGFTTNTPTRVTLIKLLFDVFPNLFIFTQVSKNGTATKDSADWFEERFRCGEQFRTEWTKKSINRSIEKNADPFDFYVCTKIYLHLNVKNLNIQSSTLAYIS